MIRLRTASFVYVVVSPCRVKFMNSCSLPMRGSNRTLRMAASWLSQGLRRESSFLDLCGVALTRRLFAVCAWETLLLVWLLVADWSGGQFLSRTFCADVSGGYALTVSLPGQSCLPYEFRFLLSSLC